MSAQTAQPATAGQLIPPENGVTVRFYRIGHGDCFLLAFPTTPGERPAYVLIDCGYKPGSPQKIDPPNKLEDILADLRTATAGHIDVAIITHEHQDHVNGISKPNFEGITIGESWFAWTEDPKDELANQLRKKYKDTLLKLLEARGVMEQMKQTAMTSRIDDPLSLMTSRMDDLLSFEFGGTDEVFMAASADPSNSNNKKSMQVFKDKAEIGVKYIRPHESPRKIPRADKLRIFALGPPRDMKMLADTDPQGHEAFPLAGEASPNSFAAAIATAADSEKSDSPFASRYYVDQKEAKRISLNYRVDWDEVKKLSSEGVNWEEAKRIASSYDGDQKEAKQNPYPFFNRYFGVPTAPPPDQNSPPSERDALLEEASDNSWREIDTDWLNAAEQFALAMGDATNNASLVLAFELGEGGKVLLFAADAQRGNWRSWADADWTDGEKKISAKDLLARTVLYKVGHHGSHNATLSGKIDDIYPNLDWMARGKHANEFTAMITAVRAWAETQKGWDHPQKAIKDALLRKAAGRVFQTDTDLTTMEKLAKPFAQNAQNDWDAFEKRRTVQDLYFDYTIEF
jgi:beta-lactamase superfamily II metal-dependent hydrolase